MQEAGFFRVLQPKRWGGYEMELHLLRHRAGARRRRHVDRLDLRRLGVHPWFMALLDDRAAQDVWGGDTSR